MKRLACALCGHEFIRIGSGGQYPDLCGECQQMLVYRPQDFERKMASLIRVPRIRERVKAWFAAQGEAALDEMWRRLDAAELMRELEAARCTRSACLTAR